MSVWLPRILAAGVAAIPVCAAGASSAPDPLPVLEARCYECHGDGSSKGGFALDDLVAEDLDANTRGQWLKVWRNIRHEFMPPADADGLSAEERRTLARWIESHVFAVDPDRADPGFVTIRRLNREEYQNTINDLFGTAFALKDQLLPDDSAHGFDNIGDAQTLSPVLFNRYLDLAEWIVSQVIVDSGPPLPQIATVDFVGPRPRDGRSRKALVAPDGVMERQVPVKLTHDDRYRIDLRVKVGGWQDYGGDARLTLALGDKVVGERTVPLGGEVDEVFSWEIDAPRGEHELSVRAALISSPAPTAAVVSAEPAIPPAAAANEPVDEARRIQRQQRLARREEMRRIFAENFPEEAANGNRPPTDPAPPQLKFSELVLTVTGPLEAGVRGDYPAPHRAIFPRGDAPADATARREYAREILQRVASRAFRRPVDEPSLDRLVEFALSEENFTTGVGAALTAVLVSPRFLYREEPQPEPDNPAASHPLDEYALASRLSYLLWLSIPDDALTAQAAAGTLRANLMTEVQRMLADPKSERFFRDFTGQWLRTRNVLMTAITPGPVADRLDPVREEMKLETDLLFEHIAREDRDLLELITADYSFLNEDLAAWYGIAGVTGSEMRKVTLPPESHRGGVLTHGSILVSTSNPNRTSPVKRGVFVLENIFGTPPPPPPAAVPALEEAAKAGTELRTLRDQLAAHREQKACAACHAHFDPIGLALENFSYIGRWRDRDGGEPIDASGEMVTGESFATFDELRALVAARQDKFYRCVTEKLMTYALGRGLEPYDAPTIDAITDRLLNGGGRFSTLLTAVIESPAFQMRRGDGVAATTVASSP